MSRRQEQFKVRGGCACSIDRRGGGFKFERSRVWTSARLTSRQMVNKPARNRICPPKKISLSEYILSEVELCECIVLYAKRIIGEQLKLWIGRAGHIPIFCQTWRYHS